MKDCRLAAEVLERVRIGQEKIYSAADLRAELVLSDADLP
jgi:predicted DNA-binding protein